MKKSIFMWGIAIIFFSFLPICYSVFAETEDGPTASCGGDQTGCVSHTCEAPSGRGAKCKGGQCGCNCNWTAIDGSMGFDSWICVPILN